MPEFLLSFVTNPGPLTSVILAFFLFLIFRSIKTNTDAVNKQSDAMLAMSTAMDKLGVALLEVARNQERSSDGQAEIIRMMERFQSAESERHHSIANSLTNLQLTMGQMGARSRA